MALLLDTTLQALPEGGYLTDGTDLYRILGRLGDGGFYELENCKTLEVTMVAAGDLPGLGLRRVVAGEA